MYKGDAFRGTFRTTQSLVVVPDAKADYGFYYQTGPTRNYGSGSPANRNGILDSYPLTGDIYNGPYGGADEDGVANDCRLWNLSGQASTANMNTYTSTYPTPTQALVHLFGSGTDPLEPPFAPILWDMNVTVDDSNANAPKAYVNYNHTCYPAHIVKVNGTVVYEYRPPINATWYLTGCLSQVFNKVIGQSQPVAVSAQ